MPHNKSQTIKSRQNHDSILEEATTIQHAKAAARPPSLNNINKNNQT